jgi:hypothetical protein
MKQRKIWLPIGCLLIAIAAAAFHVPSAGAANSGGNGLRVSPVRSDLTISPGKTETVHINVTNVTSTPATLQTIINDFTANPDESGNPAIILDPTQYASSHSLKRFISPVGNVTLQPGQQKDVAIQITIPQKAAGGGYFGAVRFAPASSSVGPGQNISLAGSVGSLILVKVPGDIKEQLSIASFDARLQDHPSTIFTRIKAVNPDKSTAHLTATVRFRNAGNVQESPFGKILLKNRSGKILGQYELNITNPPGNVLPDSVRKFSVPIDKVGKFGQFKLEGNFGYGSNGQLLSASTTFYVVPIWLILIFVGVVLLLIFLIFGLPRLIKAYNQRILRRAGRR